MNHQNGAFFFPRITLSILSVLIVLSVTGCAGAATTVEPTPLKTPDIKPGITNTPTATPPPTATATSIPTETPFVPKATIKLFVHVSLTGEFAEYGSNVKQAVELAVHDLKAPLRDLGYEAILIAYDDANDISIGTNNAKEIAADPDFLCGVGHFTTYLTNILADVYHQAGLAIISPSSTGWGVSSRGFLEVNRVLGRIEGEGIAAARFAHAEGLKRVFVVGPTWDFARVAAYNFTNEATLLGLEVVGDFTTDKAEGFDLILARVSEASPDVIFLTANSGITGAFAREARLAGYMGTLIGSSLVADPALIEFAGPLLTDGGGMYYITPMLPISQYPGGPGFIDDFEGMFASPPSGFAAQAYDATGICLTAIENAILDKGGELPARRDVALAVRAIQAYDGITGTLSFDEKGDIALPEFFVVKIISVDPGEWENNTSVTSFKIPAPR